MIRSSGFRPRFPLNTGVAAILALALTAAVAAATFALFARHPPDEGARLRGTPVAPRRDAAGFALTGARGVSVHVIERGYATTFVFFGYTHCPDECPIALASLGRAYRSLAPAARRRTRIVFVSVDPARDTPAVVQRYVAAFEPHIVGLTGSPASLAHVYAAYGVRVAPASHEIVHGGSIFAVDADGHVILEYPADVAPADLAADAMTLARRVPPGTI